MITFVPSYVPLDLFQVLRAEVPWENRDAPRDECFMSLDTTRTYSYGRQAVSRTYQASPLHKVVKALMERMNTEFGTAYNVCVLNYYKDRHQHLGWHSDDSPEQDSTHPISVVSFGAERFIYTRVKGAKGVVPDSDKYLLTLGSLFVMPGGYQETHQHKIPKHDRECEGRISLTYRKLDR